MGDDAATFRRVPDEIFNGGNLDLIEELFADDYVEHAAPPPLPPTRESVRTFVAALRAAFPDIHLETLRQWEDGDTHIGWIRSSGTMTGDFLDMPASNKSATWDEIHIARFADGKISEHWAVIDQLGMLTQLGFIPPMGGSNA